MTFLDSTYFWGILRLPNLTKTDSVGAVSAVKQTSQEVILEEYVQMFEPEFLRLLLGKTLYYNFIQGLPTETKYLVNNRKDAVYTDNPNNAKYIITSNGIWSDLRNRLFKQGKFPTSACANYVYVMIKRHTKTADVTKGTVVPQVSNATNVNDNTKMVTAWEKMLREVELFYEWLNEHEVYAEYADKNLRPHNFGVMVDMPI